MTRICNYSMGQIQVSIIAFMRDNPKRWLSERKIKSAVGVKYEIAQQLSSLVRRGYIIRRSKHYDRSIDAEYMIKSSAAAPSV